MQKNQIFRFMRFLTHFRHSTQLKKHLLFFLQIRTTPQSHTSPGGNPLKICKSGVALYLRVCCDLKKKDKWFYGCVERWKHAKTLINRKISLFYIEAIPNFFFNSENKYFLIDRKKK